MLNLEELRKRAGANSKSKKTDKPAVILSPLAKEIELALGKFVNKQIITDDTIIDSLQKLAKSKEWDNDFADSEMEEDVQKTVRAIQKGITEIVRKHDHAGEKLNNRDINKAIREVQKSAKYYNSRKGYTRFLDDQYSTDIKEQRPLYQKIPWLWLATLGATIAVIIRYLSK